MLKVNKVSEYGILTLGFVAKASEPLSAREISEGTKLPYEITAKTLQKLKDGGFLSSTKGINGGYRLQKPLSEITFAEVITAIEGPVNVADCFQDTLEVSADCARTGCCEMKSGMGKINSQIRSIFEKTSVQEILSQGEF